jgi:hypothetical protein
MPGFCEQAGSVVRHVSVPIVWRMVGEDVDVIMRRVQEGIAGEVLVELNFSNWACAGEEITLILTERDVDQMVTGIHELRGCH